MNRTHLAGSAALADAGAAILALREKARAKGWGMKLFHDRLLAAGSLPPKLTEKDVGLDAASSKRPSVQSARDVGLVRDFVIASPHAEADRQRTIVVPLVEQTLQPYRRIESSGRGIDGLCNELAISR